jgi:hypothetical protein
MPSQGSYTPTRQLDDDLGPYVMPHDSAYVAELHSSVQQLQGVATALSGDAAPACGGGIACAGHTPLCPNSAPARARGHLAHVHATP